MRGIGDIADASPMAELIEGLAHLGHSTFLHIVGDRSHASVRNREAAYLAVIARLGLESAGVLGGDWKGTTSRQAVLDLPSDTEVTAIVTANDVLVAAAIHAATERGWRVPEDVSVTGWDNSPVGEWLVPALTTVNVDHEELGRRSMARLLSRVRGTAGPVFTDPVSTVVWRRSAAPRLECCPERTKDRRAASGGRCRGDGISKHHTRLIAPVGSAAQWRWASLLTTTPLPQLTGQRHSFWRS